jgi:hypothetical protein
MALIRYTNGWQGITDSTAERDEWTQADA